MKILLLVLLVSCSGDFKVDKWQPIYEVRIEISKKCQQVTDSVKKTVYDHCREDTFFVCGYSKFGAFKTLNMFRKIANANRYCNGLHKRLIPALPSKK